LRGFGCAKELEDEDEVMVKLHEKGGRRVHLLYREKN